MLIRSNPFEDIRVYVVDEHPLRAALFLGRQGASILILDQRSSIISWFQGEGVPQKRLMRADDSCRVENAEGSGVSAQAPFAASTRSEMFVSLANQKWCVSEYTYFFSSSNAPAWHENRSEQLRSCALS
jgi:hypothetical protein